MLDAITHHLRNPCSETYSARAPPARPDVALFAVLLEALRVGFAKRGVFFFFLAL